MPCSDCFASGGSEPVVGIDGVPPPPNEANAGTLEIIAAIRNEPTRNRRMLSPRGGPRVDDAPILMNGGAECQRFRASALGGPGAVNRVRDGSGPGAAWRLR